MAEVATGSALPFYVMGPDVLDDPPVECSYLLDDGRVGCDEPPIYEVLWADDPAYHLYESRSRSCLTHVVAVDRNRVAQIRTWPSIEDVAEEGSDRG